MPYASSGSNGIAAENRLDCLFDAPVHCRYAIIHVKNKKHHFYPSCQPSDVMEFCFKQVFLLRFLNSKNLKGTSNDCIKTFATASRSCAFNLGISMLAVPTQFLWGPSDASKITSTFDTNSGLFTSSVSPRCQSTSLPGILAFHRRINYVQE